MKAKNIKRYIPFLILGAAAYALAAVSSWRGDAVLYQFFVGRDPEVMPDRQFVSFFELFESQWNHYNVVNGRFLVHFIVQLFSGLLGKQWFAVFNAIVWAVLPWSLLKLGRVAITFRSALFACALCALLFLVEDLNPPMQINYLWTALANVGFMYLFLRSGRLRGARLAGAALFSLLAGGCNECFSLPVLGAMAVCGAISIYRKSSLRSDLQDSKSSLRSDHNQDWIDGRDRTDGGDWTCGRWVMAVCYAVGVCSIIFAPSTLGRIGFVAVKDILPIGKQIFIILPGLIFPLIFLLVRPWSGRVSSPASSAPKVSSPKASAVGVSALGKGFVNLGKDWLAVFMGAVWVMEWLMCLALHFTSGVRMLIPGNLAMCVLILAYARKDKFTMVVVVITLFAAFLTYFYDYRRAVQELNDDEVIYAAYSKSGDGGACSESGDGGACSELDDGVAYVSDAVFANNIKGFMSRHDAYNAEAHRRSPGKCDIRLRPVSLREIELNSDSDRLVKIGNQAWVLVKSKRSKSKFVVHKTLLPGLVDYRMADRTLDFSSTADVTFDTTSNLELGVYINDRPYIRSDISILR